MSPLTRLPDGNSVAGERKWCASPASGAMTTQPAGRRRRWLEKTELILAHLAAVATGFVLMVVGLGLGVTMIMLPVGLVVGLLGVMLFVWGLVGHLGNDR